MKARPAAGGAAYGIAAWGAYAAVEVAVSTLRPILTRQYDLVDPSHWRFLGILLAMYLGLGALFGALSGRVAARLAARKPRSPRLWMELTGPAAALSLVTFYFANLLAGYDRADAADHVALAVALALFVLLSMRLIFPARSGWAAVASDPWLLACVLLGAPLLARSAGVRSIIGMAAGIAAAGYLSRRFLSPRRGGFDPPVRQLAAVGVALIVVLTGLSLSTRDQAPLPDPGGAPATLQAVPNVVLIVMDTVRADHTSLHDYSRDTTPKLREFAKEAVVYKRAMAPANYTLPSHASIFTGLYPRGHGAINLPPGQEFSLPLPRERQTLAETLREAGYASLAVTANIVFVRPDYGFAQGFHVFDYRQLAPCLPRGDFYLRRLMRRAMDQLLWTHEFDRTTRDAAAITTDALRLVEEMNRRRQPFFLFVNFMDAHEPYTPPAPFNLTYPGRNRRMIYSQYVEMSREVVSQQRSVSEAERAHYVSQYDGAIRYMDVQIARLLDRLRQLQLYDNSLIIVTSDHGEAFGERNFVSHAQTLYQHQLFVPLVIKYPRQREAKSDNRLVSLVDLMPTALAAAGLTPPQGLHGRNLLEADTVSRVIFAEAYPDGGLSASRPTYPARQNAVFQDNLKLISFADGALELYDLGSDPLEQRDLGSRASAAAGLRRELDHWLESVPMSAQPSRKDLDPQTLERLKALGYIR
ncbi:MAG: sulfatase-like hydrolase/transferase [Bryobacteraceae bacterium]|nr:sulfatase-like hydrolase/transferase [Bryobacteraceae bacterium]